MNVVGFDYINYYDKNLVEKFCHDKSIKKYILGINKFTKSVQKQIKIDGIIDDFTRVQRSRKKTVLKIEDVPKDSIILSVSTGSPLEVITRLDVMEFTHFNYLALVKYSSLDLLEPPFIMDFEEDFENYHDRYEKVYNLLADKKSKEIFTKVLNFKISFDFEFMTGFTNNHEEQYFDKEIVPQIKNIRFVDGGGYVGDTLSSIIKNFPDYEKIYMIEPIEENMRIAKRDWGDKPNIEFIPLGLSNKKTTLHFNDEKSFSTIYGNRVHSVEVDTIDNLITQPIDFIKLDIEGAEQDAIDGAKQSIQKYHPVLAICIYHKAEDWYKIPQKVFAINPNYKLYLRHYMEGIFETVLYFIPQKYNSVKD